MPTLQEMETEIAEIEKSFENPTPTPPKEEVAPEEVIIEEEDTEEVEVPSEDLTLTDEQQEEKKKQSRNDWKKRFTNYKAATDATIHQLRLDLSAALESSGNMYKKVQTLMTEVSTLRTQVESHDDDIFTDEEKDTLGDETISVIQKAAKKIASREAEPLREKLKLQEEETARSQEARLVSEREQAFQMFKSRLSTLVEDLDEINLDPKFAEWMQELEPYSGVQRLSMFRKAEASGDITRVAGFFKEYAATKKAKTSLLEKKVTPTGNSTGAPSPKADKTKRIWTTTQIDMFMADQVRGAFKGKESLEAEIDAEILQAIKEGRVR